MALNAIIRKQKLNFAEDKREIYVAAAQRGDVIDTEKVADFIAKDTGARPAQVKMILSALIDSMIVWLEEGHGVRLGNFGSFQPSVKSDSSENPDEAGVKRTRLTFYPSKELARRVGDISCVTENPFKTVHSGSTGGGSGEDAGGTGGDSGGENSGGSGTEMG